jgi:DNA polymerase Ligase (LigD)
MPKFAILEHDWPKCHFDFFLEWPGEGGDRLRSWRLAAPFGDCPVECEPSADHRLLYLDYEGPVSGGRGQVRRVDRGTYDLLDDSPSTVEVALHGSRFRGRLHLADGRATFVADNP